MSSHLISSMKRTFKQLFWVFWGYVTVFLTFLNILKPLPCGYSNERSWHPLNNYLADFKCQIIVLQFFQMLMFFYQECNRKFVLNFGSNYQKGLWSTRSNRSRIRLIANPDWFLKTCETSRKRRWSGAFISFQLHLVDSTINRSYTSANTWDN